LDAATTMPRTAKMVRHRSNGYVMMVPHRPEIAPAEKLIIVDVLELLLLLPLSTYRIVCEDIPMYAHTPKTEQRNTTSNDTMQPHFHEIKTVRRDVLVWFRGSLQDESKYASEHDLTKFRGGSVKDGKDTWRFDSLYNALPPGKKASGDSGYVGEEDRITVLRDAHSPELKQFTTRAKSRQEAYHTHLKSFKILAKHFQHDIHLHETCVAAVLLVQYDMVSRPLMTIIR
jgi:hypothetical protein